MVVVGRNQDSGRRLVVKLTGFGGELNVKKTQKKSNMTPVFDLSKEGDAIS